MAKPDNDSPSKTIAKTLGSRQIKSLTITYVGSHQNKQWRVHCALAHKHLHCHISHPLTHNGQLHAWGQQMEPEIRT